MSEKLREIVLDLETTGLDPSKGHKIIEIGCIEIIDGVITDNHYHQYVNPHRNIPYESYRIHGISEEFLQDKPRFADIIDDFLEYIQKDKLIIHNANFDIGFLNNELGILNRSNIDMLRVTDTLLVARGKLPGQSVSLDSLCRHYGIDISERDKKGHGALLDSKLLAEVYLELIGGKQLRLSLINGQKNLKKNVKMNRDSRNFILSKEELEAHKEFIKNIIDPIWNEVE